MLSISGEMIVSRCVAESITTDAGRFGHIGLCQLRTKLKILQCETSYIAKQQIQCLLYSLFHTAVSLVLYAVDKGLCSRNILHQLLLILLCICSQSVRPITIWCACVKSRYTSSTFSILPITRDSEATIASLRSM